MAKDHYVPASVIGRFSMETTLPARQRRVFVARRDKVFQTKAENIGYTRDLYDVERLGTWGGRDTSSVDPAVSGYEGVLPPAIDLLEQSAPIPLAVWLRTLVPWVASIFVRGADFIPRFQDRPVLQAAVEFNTRDNANRARFMELQLLLAPVCAARWVVLHTIGGEPFVINDLGLTASGDPSTGEQGWAIPLGRNSVLGIFPRRTRALAHYRAGAWWAVIEHGPVDALEASGFNDAAARSAADFVAAATGSVAQRLRPLVATLDGASQIMDAWPFDHQTKRAHDHDWHRLISATASDPQPNEVGDLQAIDAAVLGSGWCPPLILTLNMYDMPTGLTRDGNVIRLTMDKPKNYQDYFIRHDEEEHPPNARDVRMGIRRDFGALIDASSDLMRTADGLLVEEPREPINDATHVLWGEACRCHKTFLAILKLAENGYGEQGWVLARTMFEAVMSATWAHLNPDVARDRYDLYAAFADNIDTEARVATKGLFDVGREPVPMTSDERNEAVRLFGRHATGCWTGHSTLRALMEEVMSGADEWSKRVTQAYFSVTYATADRFAHSNPVSIASSIAPQGDDKLAVYNLGPSDQWIRPALTSAAVAYIQMINLQNEHVSRDPQSTLPFRRAERHFWETMQGVDVVRNLGRNDLCPCKCGKKYKNCHGKPVV